MRNLSVALALIATLVAGTLWLPVTALAESDELPIAAKNAIVVDADTGRVLLEHNADRAVAPASLTKIFTTIVALESAAPETVMTVDPYDLVGEASIGLLSGEQVTLETLLYGLMLTSGNDAAMTTARSLGNLPGDSPQESVRRFVERANTTASRLGLENTHLRNPHGLDQDGHVSSASDIAAITMYALNNPMFQQLISTPYHSDGSRELYNVNRMLDGYSGLIGGKTGITGRAGHCLMQVAYRDGRTVIVVLLGSTQDRWYDDARYLLDLGFEELKGDPESNGRRTIGLAANTSIEVPEVDEGQSVGGNLTVDRISDHEAVVRPSNPISGDDSLSWRWPLVSVAMMGVALVLALNFPALVGLGTLALVRGSRVRLGTPSLSTPAVFDRMFVGLVRPFRRGPSSSPTRSSTRTRTSRGTRGSRNNWSQRPRNHGRITTESQPVTISPSSGRAEKAIKLAMQSRYHAATDEFKRALELDPGIDLTKVPGFWRMQAMGYIAAAKAYLMNGQTDDARRLLTVVQLAFSNSRELSSLFARAIRTLDQQV